ncbi:putative cytochrome P450 oxidoreductase [Phyllosticta citribraziliensis]|uniref:Cytochrome P450 oxidoreductase n=1 Tax=Phyllosticta citribraziliensis TaxID=989973 RepID=A0ABR1L8E5_9PEZI
MATGFKFQVVFQHLVANVVPILLTAVVLRLLYNKFKPGIWTIPGPPLAAWTGLWFFFQVRGGKTHQLSIDLHRKYGPLVRINPNKISVADPREIRNIYGLNKGFTKTAFYPIQSIIYQRQFQVNLFSVRDEDYHRHMKRAVANAYSMTALLDKEDAVDDCIRLFMEKLTGFAEKNQPVDLGMWLQLFAFDVVGELSFSTRLGFLEKGQDVDGMMETIRGLLAYSAQVGQLPEWHHALLGNPLLRILLPSMETWNEITNFTLRAIDSVNSLVGSKTTTKEQKREFLSARTDMLSRWTAIELTSPEKINARDILVHLSTNVLAGSDTTAIALRAIFYYLLKTPPKLAKLVAHIDAADAAGLLSNPVTFREATTHLPYLDAVIKEAMRLHPSVGLILEREVPAAGATICGRHVPGGTIVGVNPWVTGYDSNIFPEPEAFVPERWLDSNSEALRDMEMAWFGFGAGSRTCMGKNMSMIEMCKVVPQFLREFELGLDEPEREWTVNNQWFTFQEDFVVRLKKRSS